MPTLGDSLRYLRSQGFEPVAARRPARAFAGVLHCVKGPVPVTLEVRDWNFLEYPHIALKQLPKFLPQLLPHVDVNLGLCYFAPGSVTLDRYDPVIALVQCINQATDLLNKVATDPDLRDTDIQSEFPAHWAFGQLPLPWNVYLGNVKEGEKNAHYFKLQNKEKTQTRVVICSDPGEAHRLARSWSWNATASSQKCWLLKTDRHPFIPEQMPSTVRELFLWLRQWDTALSAGLQSVLGADGYLDKTYVTFAINTPVGWIGFGFDLQARIRLGYKRSPKKYRNYLHNAGGMQKLFRLSINPIGSEFVHSRNLSFPDLSGKRVTVIGCGAVGSFVASAVARLGAGTGRKGMLRLVDPDLLGPENLGRHTLGYPSLFQKKSVALSEDLLRQFPHSVIEALAQSVFEMSTLFRADLIIDATGEESVSEYLNGLRVEGKHGAPILHVWIRGNGEAVQALWANQGGDACYRCLLVPDPKLHRQERIQLLKKQPDRRMDGCRAFTPYAVSAPMQAASLAVDMICDWLQGDPSPKFRTRTRENVDVFKTKNQNLSRIQGCPACDPH